ncbi:metalloregulator ArsR/SmtB family transcription factor [Nocardioides sp.]|uniref:ArsR/SmtB family transcription factor n=1 Tax=Nocardioides sp. TaxID=35761 RepID=UPI002ED7AEBC
MTLETWEDRAALLGVVADPVRLRLLEQLAHAGTRCVCNLQTDPPIAANLLSYHLRVLREARLVTAQKRGRWVDYTLAEDALDRLALALPRPDSVAVGTGSCRTGGAT